MKTPSESEGHGGATSMRPGVAVDAAAKAVRLALAVTSTSTGLLGFTMEQPTNTVIRLREDAPCAHEGLLRVGDVVEALDGVSLDLVQPSRHPNQLKELLVVRRSANLVDMLLRARPALVRTEAGPELQPLWLTSVALGVRRGSEGEGLLGLRTDPSTGLVASAADEEMRALSDDLIVEVNGEAVAPSLAATLDRLHANGRLNSEARLLIVRGLEHINPAIEPPAASAAMAVSAAPAPAAAAANAPRGVRWARLGGGGAEPAAVGPPAEADTGGAKDGGAGGEIDPNACRLVTSALRAFAPKKQGDSWDQGGYVFRDPHQDDDDFDPEKGSKALARVAEHLPPVSTANAAELAAALLMTGPELRLFFDSKTDIQGRCGRRELELFLLEVTKLKAVVPENQRLVAVRCFVGELCNRAKRDALLWTELEGALVSVASKNRRMHSGGQAAKFITAMRQRMVVTRAASRRAVRAAQLHHHQLNSGLVPSLADQPDPHPKKPTSPPKTPGARSGSLERAESNVSTCSVESYSAHRRHEGVRAGVAGESITLNWPTGHELHRTGDHAPLTFSEVMEYLALINVPQETIIELVSQDVQPTFQILQDIATAHDGTLKNVGRLRAALLFEDESREAEREAQRRGTPGTKPVERKKAGRRMSVNAKLHSAVQAEAIETMQNDPEMPTYLKSGDAHRDISSTFNKTSNAIEQAMNATQSAMTPQKQGRQSERFPAGSSQQEPSESVAAASQLSGSRHSRASNRHLTPEAPREMEGALSPKAPEAASALTLGKEPRLLEIGHARGAYFLRGDTMRDRKMDMSESKSAGMLLGKGKGRVWFGDMKPRVWDITEIPSDELVAAREPATRTRPLSVSSSSALQGSETGLMSRKEEAEVERMLRRATMNPETLLGLEESALSRSLAGSNVHHFRVRKSLATPESAMAAAM